jgi:hypothetical protein
MPGAEHETGGSTPLNPSDRSTEGGDSASTESKTAESKPKEEETPSPFGQKSGSSDTAVSNTHRVFWSIQTTSTAFGAMSHIST